jgi:hypothetical protein
MRPNLTVFNLQNASLMKKLSAVVMIIRGDGDDIFSYLHFNVSLLGFDSSIYI